MSNRKQAYFDGSCKENPGETGSWGFVICDPWIEKSGTIHGDKITNNLSEYTALLELLEELRQLHITGVDIFGDSKLVCNIINKRWGNHKGKWNPHRKYPRLNRLATRCERLLKEGGHSLSWVPREENQTADSIAENAYQ